MANKRTSPAYTMGPWRLTNRNEICADNKQETFIAEVFDENEAWAANARLIATTPELLEACEAQLENWRMLQAGAWDGNPEGVQLAIDQLENVIARAYGKLP
jgi:hypothetical protein